MKAEILSVGTELLLGNIANTDAQMLSVMLSELGINVYWHSVVGDNPERLRAAVAIARGRADLIITTGGLGPTCDDLTKQTLAQSFGLDLYFDERAEAEMERYFRLRLGRPMTDNNRQQAWLPTGCVPFYNTCGTAPGCAFCVDGVHVIMLPGPPKEARAMMEHGGLDYLRALSGGCIRSHNIHIYGMGESYCESLLRERMNALTNPTLAPYAAEAEMRLRVTARADTAAEAETMMQPLIGEIRALLGDVIYGLDTGSLENTCLQLLTAQHKTLSAAESCTGGLIAQRITALPGASAVFMGGVTAYTNAVKQSLVGVRPETLAEHTAVSRPVAVELAEGIRARIGTDYGIGVTGLAGPDGDGVHPVGTIFVALAGPAQTWVRPLQLSPLFDRSKMRLVASSEAFDMLRRALTDLPVEAAKY